SSGSPPTTGLNYQGPSLFDDFEDQTTAAASQFVAEETAQNNPLSNAAINAPGDFVGPNSGAGGMALFDNPQHAGVVNQAIKANIGRTAQTTAGRSLIEQATPHLATASYPERVAEF